MTMKKVYWVLAALLLSAQSHAAESCVNLAGKYFGQMRYEHVGAEEPITYAYEVKQTSCAKIEVKITYYASAPGYTEQFTEVYAVGAQANGPMIFWAADGLYITQAFPNITGLGSFAQGTTRFGLDADGNLMRSDVTTRVDAVSTGAPSTQTVIGRYLGKRL